MEEDFEFSDDQEADDGIDSEKHWKSLGIASAVIFVICIIIVFAIFLLTPRGQKNGDFYRLEEVFGENALEGHQFNGSWISDTEFVYLSPDKNIVLYNAKNHSRVPLTHNRDRFRQKTLEYMVSPRRGFILFKNDVGKLFQKEQKRSRHRKCLFEYELYYLKPELSMDLTTKFLSLLSDEFVNAEITLNTRETNKQSNNFSNPVNSNSGKQHQKSRRFQPEQNRNDCPVQYAEWIPDDNNERLVLIINNDIYRLDFDSEWKLTNARPNLTRLTFDGSKSGALSIINGLNDQVYRDFIFQKPASLYWSKNASRKWLCYLKIDNSKLPVEKSLYKIDNSAKDIVEEFHYSTIESGIGAASLWILDIDSAKPRSYTVECPARVTTWEHYITSVEWNDSTDSLLVIWTRRNQKLSIVSVCNSSRDEHSSSATNNAADDNHWKCTEIAELENWFLLKDVPNSVLQINYRSSTDIGDVAPNSTHSNSNQSTVGRQSSFLQNNGHYILCCHTPTNGERQFHQLYSLDLFTGTISPYLNTAASLDTNQYLYRVSQIVAFNTKLQLIFFVAQSLTRNVSLPITEQDMRPNLYGYSIQHRTLHCLTCQIVGCFRSKLESLDSGCFDIRTSTTTKPNDDDASSCLMKSVHFSESSQFALLTCLAGIVPRTYLIQFSTNGNEIVESVTMFEDNSELEQKIETKMIPNVESFIISRELPDTVKYLRLKILTPLGFSSNEMAEYPFVFEFFPAKFAQNSKLGSRAYFVENYPDNDWALHMVSEHRFVYGWLDGELSDSALTQIGKWPGEYMLDELIDDYSAVLDFVQTNFTFVDFDKSCALGHNVGAFLLLNRLSDATATKIPCGIAISPIVEWNDIHSVISEQYLDLDRFKSNDGEYLMKINLNRTALNDRKLMIIHGTANHLIPFTQSMHLWSEMMQDEQNTIGAQIQKRQQNSTLQLTFTSERILDPFVNEDNALDGDYFYFYRKIEFFIFKFIVGF